jgi:hypothetical protein
VNNRPIVRLALIGLACAAGCKDSSGPPTPNPGSGIARIEFTYDRPRPSYPVHDTTRIQVHYFGADGGPFHGGVYREAWRSLDPGVATVDDHGLVTMTGQGTTSIEVDADGVVARTAITVKGVLHREITASEHWTAAESPHVVEGLFDPIGPDTVVLTIDPGATVLFRPGSGLAFGITRASRLVLPGPGPVVFAGDSAGYGTWTGLILDSRHRHELRNLTLRHCGSVGPTGAFVPCITFRRNLPTPADPGLLVQDVTIDSASGAGLVIEVGADFAPGSRNLSVRNTHGIIAEVPAMAAARFPHGTFTGNTANEIRVNGGILARPTAWQSLDVLWHLTGTIHVEGSDSAALAIPAGFTARADAGVQIVVGGTLAMGEPGGAPVLIEAQDARGWDGVELGVGSGPGSFHNTTLRGCGTGGACLRVLGSVGAGQPVLADHLTIQDSRGDGVLLTGLAHFDPASAGLAIHGSQGAPITLPPNDVPSLPAGDYGGNGQGGFRLRDEPFTGTAAWRDLGLPYLAPNGVEVLGDLTLQPGVTVKVGHDGRFAVGHPFTPGTLRVLGTAAAPVVLTSLDGDAAGAWVGLELGAPSAAVTPETRLEYLVLRNAGAGEPGASGALRMWSDPGGVLRNSSIVSSAGCGIVLFDGQSWHDDYASPAFGNGFTNVAGPVRCRWPAP